jgi:molybdopterin-guanine dinucleotide biosynthesis protein A
VVGHALIVQCDALIVCGREDLKFDCIPDLPTPDLGPLGGLNAALDYALTHNFDTVLSAGCDIPNLPLDLCHQLAGKGAAIVESQPVVGIWPATLSHQLDQYIKSGGRALYGFADLIGARKVSIEPPLMNVNHPNDLKD